MHASDCKWKVYLIPHGGWNGDQEYTTNFTWIIDDYRKTKTFILKHLVYQESSEPLRFMCCCLHVKYKIEWPVILLSSPILNYHHLTFCGDPRLTGLHQNMKLCDYALNNCDSNKKSYNTSALVEKEAILYHQLYY